MAAAVHQPTSTYTWVPTFLFPPQHVQDQVERLRRKTKSREFSTYTASDFPLQKFPKVVDKMEVLPTTSSFLPKVTKTISFPIYQIPTPRTIPQMKPAVSPPSTPARPLSFLHFPLEIRLQIYSYILQDHPVHHAHLSPIPGLDDEGCKAFTQANSWPQGLSYLISISSRSICSAASQNTQNKVSYRAGKMPTMLLQTCHQIYDEARIMPFHHNVFAYVNWFKSGIYAACRFTRGLQKWQMQGLRSIALDVLAMDLVYDEENGKTSEGWTELCGMWSGVWTLQLKIKGNATGKADAGSITDDEPIQDDATNGLTLPTKASKKACVLDVDSHWVINGLATMKHLKRIELSIESQSVLEETKKAFCEALGEKLTLSRKAEQGNGSERVSVLYIEGETAAPEVKEVKKEE
ncbi:hypothetical protein F5884DRAFT_852986 [Xylogone sp. PMI_703]|nr:hypothetical protein F5884DRAFT_852986 [Xylogone sp. PMI_703]